MTTTSMLPDVGIELREGYAQIGDTNLHYVEAGDGPLLVLLHGFPEFWFGWRRQIAPLAAAGFRVIAPDTRGYNLSSKPEGFEDYGVDLLAADIRGLIAERGADSALCVGHYWRCTIALLTVNTCTEGADAGMINYYLSTVRQSHKEAAAKLRPISAPTLVIWGERDSYLGSDLAEPDRGDVPNLDRVERLADASHWVHHDEAERVNQLLIDFFAAPAAA